ncbi:MAG TPA: alpha/beta hydrolase [Candidatus Cybelea sp.]|jgi:acetyl esterase/lipase
MKRSANVVVHPLTSADAKAREALRSVLSPQKGQVRGIALRPAFEAILRQTPAAKDVEYVPDTIAGIPGVWCRPPKPTDRTILWLHGGWFVGGSADAYSNFIGHFAARSGAAAFIPDYRLAPEHPYPAAVEEVHAAYNGLLDRGLGNVVLAGDSAGGTLALDLLDWVRSESAARPRAAVLISPITDLSLSGESWETREAADVLFTKEQARELIAFYLADADPSRPFSPLRQDIAGFPPLRIHVGDDEVLLDDSVRLVQRAEEAGVDARLDVWEGMLHGFPASLGTFEAANNAVDEIAAFIRAC